MRKLGGFPNLENMAIRIYSVGKDWAMSKIMTAGQNKISETTQHKEKGGKVITRPHTI
jgi:hypothetical protein